MAPGAVHCPNPIGLVSAAIGCAPCHGARSADSSRSAGGRFGHSLRFRSQCLTVAATTGPSPRVIKLSFKKHCCFGSETRLAIQILLAASLFEAHADYMTGQGPTGASSAVGQPLFATTHWSVVLAAADQKSPEAAGALEQLCLTYWRPLYVYVRRRGYGMEDAQDLTQGFLSDFLSKGAFDLADPARGRFRTFVLKSLQHFLTDEWKRAHRIKRGGGKLHRCA